MSIPTTTQPLASSIVQFLTSDRREIVARITNIDSTAVAFELMTSEVPVLVSETLSDAAIRVGGKLAYEGDLTILGVTQSGLVTHVEARLEQDWITDENEKADFPSGLEDDLETHTVNWAEEHELRPSFRAVVADLQIYLEGLESWCNDIERRYLFGHSDREAREAKLLAKVGPIVSREVESHFADYEREAAQLSSKERLAHREHVMRIIHPLFLTSPFNYRCYKKPLGYAGDYGMVQLMLGNPFQGSSLFAKLLNNACLETGPVKAHRNRIDYLVNTLREKVSKRAEKGLRTRILNLGCGPAEEVQRFIEEEAVAESCDFELLDFSEETLDYAKAKVKESCDKAGRAVNVTFIKESIQGFLRQAARCNGYENDSYDLVYCAGLFDYLQQRFCCKLTATLYDICKPEGLAVVTNVSNHNTIPGIMADLLEWNIIDRSEEEMLALAPSENLNSLKELKSDSTRINLFLELQKSAATARDAGAIKETEAENCARLGMVSQVSSRRGSRANS
jgi:extracellular factor (EF) 3-hydroxypalmitic acid methyl ester biosynthesis protein